METEAKSIRRATRNLGQGDLGVRRSVLVSYPREGGSGQGKQEVEDAVFFGSHSGGKGRPDDGRPQSQTRVGSQDSFRGYGFHGTPCAGAHEPIDLRQLSLGAQTGHDVGVCAV